MQRPQALCVGLPGMDPSGAPQLAQSRTEGVALALLSFLPFVPFPLLGGVWVVLTLPPPPSPGPPGPPVEVEEAMMWGDSNDDRDPELFVATFPCSIKQ